MVESQRVWKLFVVAVLAALLVSQSWGQTTTGTILGVVSDESGARIPGVAVTITNLETGAVRTIVTDGAGRYRAPNLPLGQYEVKTELSGFRTAVRSGLQLTVGAEIVLDLSLTVGAVNEQVEVSGEAPLVETTNATVSGLVTDQQVRDLPLNGRSFENLIFLQAGVVPFLRGAKSNEAGEGTKLAVGGSRIDANSFLLDGTSMNDQSNMTPGSAAGVLLGVDTLREFRVMTSNYSAEYGRVSGGVINAVTKSGGNSFHGNVFEYLRNSALDARNFFDRQINPSDPRLPAFKRNQLGGTFGGRIVRDRTFFFVGYEALRERLGVTQLSYVPTVEARSGSLRDAAGALQFVGLDSAVAPYMNLFPVPNGPTLQTSTGALTNTATFLSNPAKPTRDDFGSIRVDQQLSPNHSFFLRYTLDDSETTFTNPNRLLTPTPARNQYGTLSETAVLSPSVVNLARFAASRSFSFSSSKLLYDVPQSLWFFPDQAQFGLITFRTGGLDSLGTVLGIPQRWIHETWTVTDDLTVTKGRQTLKMGFLLDRIRENSLKLRVVGGQYFFNDLGSFLRNSPDEIDFQPSGTDQIRGWRQILLGGYFQDDIQLRPNLTFNLGLRYEFATVPTEVNGKLGNFPDPLHDVASRPHVGDPWFDGSARDFAPRIGLAWDPFSNGKTSVRAGFGLYHDHIIAEPYNRVFAFDYPFSLYLQVRNIPPGTVTFPRINPNAGTSAADPLNQVSFSVAGQLKDPTKASWTFGIQQQMARSSVVSATYVGSHSYHMTLNFNGNPAVSRTDAVTGRRFVPQPAQFRNPNMGQVYQFMVNGGNVYYQGLQLSVIQRMSRGFQAQLSYTWSKTIADGDGPLGRILNPQGRTGTTVVQDSDNVRADRSLAQTDFRHAATVNFTYELPFARSLKGVAGTVLSGWALNGILTATTGNPFGPVLGFDWSNSRVRGGGLGDRPDLKPGGNQNPVHAQDPNHYFDPTQFELPNHGTPGYFGNLGRQTLIGPGLANFDFSFVKNTRLGVISEAANLQFRGEFFNILNRANFSLPFNQPLTRTGAIDSRAGVIDRTATSSRQVQFALKLIF